MNKTLSVCSIIVLVSSLVIFLPNQSFANNEYEEVKWQLVYLSDQPGCGKYHHDMKTLYEELTEKYMTEVYKFENSKYLANCIPERDFEQLYTQPDDLDLLILVYEKSLGERDLHSKQIGGLYYHGGDSWVKNHTIIICDCSSFDFSEPTWILTHELSHFILYYLGYPESIVEKRIHSLDEKYDECLEGKYNSECDSVKTKLRLDSRAYAYNVMSPYEPAIESNSLRSFGNLTFAELFGDKNGIQVIIKWWLEKKISDDDLQEAMDKIIDYSIIPAKELDALTDEKSLKIFTDPPKGKQEVVFEYSDYENNSLKKLDSVLSKIPQFKELSKTSLTKSNDMADSNIPDWVKEKMQSWVDDKISEKDVLIGLKQIVNQKYLEKMNKGIISFEGGKDKNFDSHSIGSIADDNLSENTDIRLINENKVVVAGMVIPELGTTNIGIRDKSISSSSIIIYELQSLDNKKTQQLCEGVTVTDGKFFLHCKNNIDNTVIQYKVYSN